MERITVTVCWVAPDGTFDQLRGAEWGGAGGDPAVVRAAANHVANESKDLIFVNATSEEV